tara:strand:- start:103 stop:336 length:234 start_codon:yes stop_codon:yes gene_type:complete
MTTPNNNGLCGSKRFKISKTEYECYIIDDGTLDTVIEINNNVFRFDTEYASIYRDKNGFLTHEGLIELVEETIKRSE